MLAREWPLWRRWYAPVSVRGKDVLDVGAGCGETAYFYFKQGARKVICVEQDRAAIECLTENATRHSWNVEIVHEAFRLDMLREYRFDFIKMDGEGCEKELLQLSKLPTTAVVESHSPQLTDELTRHFGARVVTELVQGISLMHITDDEAKSNRKSGLAVAI
jgi:SAM-dependent methyltransferase